MLFGFYPYEEQWRPLLAMFLLVVPAVLQPEQGPLEKIPAVCLAGRPGSSWDC
jgi:hypothetical protein